MGEAFLGQSIEGNFVRSGPQSLVKGLPLVSQPGGKSWGGREKSATDQAAASVRGACPNQSLQSASALAVIA